MCTFITLGVPADRAGTLRSRASKHRLSWAPPGDGEVGATLPSGWVAGWLTDGHCACDLMRWRARDDRARRERKYRAKGWSESKIARALAAADDVGGQCASEALLRLLEDTLGDTQEIVFHAATYAGRLEDGAEAPLVDCGRIELAEVRSAKTRLEPGGLYRIHASPK